MQVRKIGCAGSVEREHRQADAQGTRLLWKFCLVSSFLLSLCFTALTPNVPCSAGAHSCAHTHPRTFSSRPGKRLATHCTLLETRLTLNGQMLKSHPLLSFSIPSPCLMFLHLLATAQRLITCLFTAFSTIGLETP